MITSKADLRRWGQLVNVIEFTTSIKMCVSSVKGNKFIWHESDDPPIFEDRLPPWLPHRPKDPTAIFYRPP